MRDGAVAVPPVNTVEVVGLVALVVIAFFALQRVLRIVGSLLGLVLAAVAALFVYREMNAAQGGHAQVLAPLLPAVHPFLNWVRAHFPAWRSRLATTGGNAAARLAKQAITGSKA